MATQDNPTVSPLKQCSGHCGREMPRTAEFFRPARESRDGFRNECRECEREAQATPEGRAKAAARQATYRARKAKLDAIKDDPALAKEHPELAAELVAKDQPPTTKRCRIHGEELPLTAEFFHVRETSKDGFRNECRECVRKKQEEYNRSEERKQARYDRESELRKTDSVWREKQNAPVREWQARREPEERHEYEAQPHVKDSKAKWHRDWVQENPDQHKANGHKYRARKRGAEGSYTPDDLTRIMDEQKCTCFYCDESIMLKWTVDHFIPLSRGGSNWPDNIRLACKRCNSEKHDKLPSEFTPKVKRY